ncbi:predicted protein [Sparassis crispa]|uniref:C2H2-type domain-containing protein n=1 Tax=Sparassis crispa TaxID=139825 RepID=A0A401GE71_9APHY|nr:predicted protein [Sparassis crispa]GBE80470.1 predicted protein [Sparassis crispa]
MYEPVILRESAFMSIGRSAYRSDMGRASTCRSPLAMNPSRPSDQTNNQDPRTMSADGSHYQYHASSQTASHLAHAGGLQQPSYYHPSRYNSSDPPYPSSHYTPQHSQYPQTTAAHQAPPSNMYSNARIPELTLRDLPFSNTHPTSALGRQGHPGYGAATVPPQPYRPCSHPTSSSAQYGSSMSSLQSLAEGHQYYSTPAHTMQMYPPHGSHTPGPHASIVIPPSTPEAPTVERYQCDKCDKTFGRSHDRKRHFETQHMQPHPHLCPQCKKSFSRGDSLKRHIDNGGCEKAPY